MPSEKVSRILKARGLPAERIASMSEREAWDFVYSTAAPKKVMRIEICFTGFTDQEKTKLTQMASQAGMHVVTNVTKSLSFLCAGENAGPVKLSKAREQKAVVMDRAQFEHLLQTGEITS